MNVCARSRPKSASNTNKTKAAKFILGCLPGDVADTRAASAIHEMQSICCQSLGRAGSREKRKSAIRPTRVTISFPVTLLSVVENGGDRFDWLSGFPPCGFLYRTNPVDKRESSTDAQPFSLCNETHTFVPITCSSPIHSCPTADLWPS